MDFRDEMTLGTARALLRGLVDDGHRCPCCTQMAKVYKRQIHGTMARTLIRMYRAAPPGEWLYLPDIPQKSRDSTGMAWWGLIVEETEKRDDGGRAGWWRLTVDGKLFTERLVKVPKYARVYDGRVLSLLGEPVDIVDCLGVRFNYDELMNA